MDPPCKWRNHASLRRRTFIVEVIVASASTQHSRADMQFGLIFFASSEAPDGAVASGGDDRYRLLIDSVRFADRHGFSSVWIPERHFTRDGWLYPNPVVLQAALARETSRISLRAGSVVMPLHNPLRVAEEWAMVDNLSGGRVGISFASGWHPNDFALFPEHYADRNEEMYRGIQTVQRLWRGEKVQVRGGDGTMVEIRTYPPPVQPTLPTWITAAGNPRTFARAGEIGANLLTHLYNHGIEELAERIQLYREARARHGHDPQGGQVSVMLHTFVWEQNDQVLARARAVFCEYLKSAAYLVDAIAFSRGQKIDLTSLSEQDSRDYLNFVFERLISTQRVLFGTPESCLEVVARLQAIGVSEIACQMDFGLDAALVLQSLQQVDRLKELSRAGAGGAMPPAAVSVTLAPHTPADALDARLPERLGAIQQRCREAIEPDRFYDGLQSHGIQLAASFRGIERLWRGDGEALGWIRLPAEIEPGLGEYQVHPALLDACLQVLVAALPAFAAPAEAELPYLPAGLRSFRIVKRPGKSAWSHARLMQVVPREVDVFEGDVRLLDETGHVLVEALGLRLQRSEPALRAVRPGAGQVDQLYYELRWEESASWQVAPPAPSTIDTWLICMDGSGVGQCLSDLLSDRGAACIELLPAQTYQVRQRGRRYGVNVASGNDIRRAIDDALADADFSRCAIVHLWSLDIQASAELNGAALEQALELGVGSALNLLQALCVDRGTARPRLWFVTRGAQAAGPDDAPLAVAQAPLWGLGKTCAIEHPELWGGLVDVDPREAAPATALQLLAALTHHHSENQLAFRRGRSYVARLVRRDNQPQSELTLRPDASYLISGGLWGLGFEAARWLAERGARHLVLLGRSSLPPRETWASLQTDSRLGRQVAGIRELEEAGVDVQYASVDVGDEQQLAGFLRAYRARQPLPICGVLHAASIWQDRQGQSLVRPLVHLDQEAVRAVFRPKVVGGWNLYRLLQDAELDFFVLFSSGASLFGSAAQGNYAAAGSFLDALAHYARAAGRPALSVDLGAVSATGFGATQEGLRVHEYWESHGIERITPSQVLAALELLIPQRVAQVGVMKLDWSQLQQFYPQLANLPLFAHLAAEGIGDGGRQVVPSAAQSAFLQSLSMAELTERRRLLEEYLRQKVAGVLRLSASALDSESSLTMLGLDSLMAIELKNRIELELQVHIPIVTFLQGPSITQFAGELLAQLAVPTPEAPEQPPQPAHAQETRTRLSIERADAAQLLAQLDQLSDGEVDALLGSALQQEDAHAQAKNGLNPQEASQLLANIEAFSDSEVDSLLNRMLITQEERGNQ
jgi:phthiocerol/phenolphthiocerol synthesis type-I polyketide synthase D